MSKQSTEPSHPKLLLRTFITEWPWWLPGTVLSFFLASILLSGWPMGLVPNLDYPYSYTKDSLSYAWTVQRVIEGWIFDNPRSGYPFGSNFLDYPSSDFGNLLIIKFLGLLSGSYYSATNLYFLLGFPVIFMTSFCVLYAIGLSRTFAWGAALLFTFIPFHFLRIEHLFYTWYFCCSLIFLFRILYFFCQSSQCDIQTKKTCSFSTC